MGILSWIVGGALVGWIAGRFVGGDEGQGCLTNIVIGIGGALLGGAVYTMITGEDLLFPFSLEGLVVAVIASAVLLAVLTRLRRT